MPSKITIGLSLPSQSVTFVNPKARFCDHSKKSLKYVTSLPHDWDDVCRVTKSLHCKNLHVPLPISLQHYSDVPLPISLQHYSDVAPPTTGELLLAGRSRRLAAAGSHLLQAKTSSSLYDRTNLQIISLLELFLIHLDYAWKITQICSPSIKKVQVTWTFRCALGNRQWKPKEPSLQQLADFCRGCWSNLTLSSCRRTLAAKYFYGEPLEPMKLVSGSTTLCLMSNSPFQTICIEFYLKSTHFIAELWSCYISLLIRFGDRVISLKLTNIGHKEARKAGQV